MILTRGQSFRHITTYVASHTARKIRVNGKLSKASNPSHLYLENVFRSNADNETSRKEIRKLFQMCIYFSASFLYVAFLKHTVL